MGSIWERKIKKFMSQSKKIGKISAPKYITAYDPLIKRRVVFIVKNGWAISLVTGHKFWYGN